MPNSLLTVDDLADFSYNGDIDELDISSMWAWSPEWATAVPDGVSNRTILLPSGTARLWADEYILLVAKRLEFHLIQWVEEFDTEIGIDDPTAERRYAATYQFVLSSLDVKSGVDLASTIDDSASPFSVALKILSYAPIRTRVMQDITDRFPVSSDSFVRDPELVRDCLETLQGDRNLEDFLYVFRP